MGIYIKAVYDDWCVYSKKGSQANENISSKPFSGTRCSNLCQRLWARFCSCVFHWGYYVRINGELNTESKPTQSKQAFPSDTRQISLSGPHYFWVDRDSWSKYCSNIRSKEVKEIPSLALRTLGVVQSGVESPIIART